MAESRAVYLGWTVRQGGDVQKGLTAYQWRFGCRPARAVVSERCSFTEQLEQLDGVAVDRSACMLPADLYLEIPGGGER